ncbi:MAG: putative Glycosyl transferase, group 1 [Dehalococcoidia bacterium]|nr:putative Glycosyl transferase, group 1 [Dehalococcoidia bacterium]
MKIIQVVHQYLPKYVGGTEIYVNLLAKGLTERGHELVVFCGGDSDGRQEYQGVPVVSVPGGLRGPRGVAGNFLTAFSNPGAERAFRELCQEERPDVVHFHHVLGLSSRLVAIARELGVPTVYTLHDYWFVCPNGQLFTEYGHPCDGPVLGVNCGVCAALRLGAAPLALLAPAAAPVFILRQRFMREAVSASDLILAPSQFMLDTAVKSGLPQSKLRLLSLGIEKPVVTDLRPPKDGLMFSYIGSIARTKGVHVLVEAFNRVADTRAELRIYGDTGAYPEYSQGLRRMASNPKIKFMGPLSRDRLGEALGNTDALIVPSLWYENYPLVVQEAFAAGVPVIASNSGSLAHLVQDGVNWLLFETGKPRDLEAKIRLLVANPRLIDDLRCNTPLVKGVKDHIMELEETYFALVAGTPGKAGKVGQS